MEIKSDKLNLFFNAIKNLGFWQRIFGWRQISNLFIEAYKEFVELINSFKIIKEKYDAAEKDLSGTKSMVLSKEEILKLSEKKTNDQEKEIELLKERLNRSTDELKQLRVENTIYKQNERNQKTEYDKSVANLNSIKEQIQKDRQKEVDDRHQADIQQLATQKDTWSKHQERVKEVIKLICAKHTIEYLDKVPFKGSPDNTIKICDEFVIFDAKSPLSEDLTNFPKYIKEQTERVNKYIKEENVRKDIFLVIPSNTVDVVKQYAYNMSDYNVYVVTLDVLEPLILSLQKIETYEYFKDLTPEERENICRIIGKFTHLTKRKIQVDHYFINEFIDALKKCENDLPENISSKVEEFELSEMLNPPQEKRNKKISTKDLETENTKIENNKILPRYKDNEVKS